MFVITKCVSLQRAQYANLSGADSLKNLNLRIDCRHKNDDHWRRKFRESTNVLRSRLLINLLGHHAEDPVANLVTGEGATRSRAHSPLLFSFSTALTRTTIPNPMPQVPYQANKRRSSAPSCKPNRCQYGKLLELNATQYRSRFSHCKGIVLRGNIVGCPTPAL